MKNSKILALSLCLILILGLSFAMAVGNKTGKEGSNKNGFNNKSKNIESTKRTNYGLCVSAQTKVRNSCYQENKNQFKTCEMEKRQQFRVINFTDSSVNKTQVREQLKEKSKTCKENYMKELDSCKAAFKAKKGACEIAKPKALNSTTCNAGGGRWNECGSRCTIDNQGKGDVACTAMCEALCECGTIAGLTCPKGYTCKIPKGIADAMGYCR